MRVFLDENVDVALGPLLAGHEVCSVRDKGWFGVTNGELLKRIEGEFEVLVSHDAGLAHQQNWQGRKLALVVIVASSTALGAYTDHIEAIRSAIAKSAPGSVAVVGRR